MAAFSIRPLAPADEAFLWQMLYQAIYVPPGEPVPPLKIVHEPTLAHYVAGWGRDGDMGFVAVEAGTGQRVGAVWLRQFAASDRGYGYLDDDTPELSIAILPIYRGRGIGTRLLRELLESPAMPSSVSLSVQTANAAKGLYERLGFLVEQDHGEDVVMRWRRDPRQR